jgi:hypothetical protein
MSNYTETKVISVNPDELAEAISKSVKNETQSLIKKYVNEKMNDIINSQNKMQYEKPMTKEEVANYFDVSLGCINDWMNRGYLKYFKVGQRTYFKRYDVENINKK